MKTKRYWFVVNAKGDARIRTRRPWDLKQDEVAVCLNVKIPDSWGRVMNDEITVTLPEARPSVEAEGEIIVSTA